MSIIEKVNDKSLAIQIAIASSLMAVSGLASADSKLINSSGQSSYAADTLGGSGVKGSFIDGKGGGVEGLETSMGNLTKVVVAVFAFIGFCLAGYGLYILWKASQPNTQSKSMNGLIAILVGSALAILPYIVFSGGNTLTNFGG